MWIDLLSFAAFAPPLVGQMRGARPASVAALAVLGMAGVALVYMALLLRPGSGLALAARSSGYHDLYYVVGHAHHLMFIAIVTVLLSGLLVLKDRIAGPLHDVFLAVALWAYLLSALGTIVVRGLVARLLMPRRYVDYPGGLVYVNYASLVMSYVAIASLAALVIGVGAAFLRRWRRG